MRITGGILRGRKIRTPGNKIRPTQDKVREALFSILDDKVCKAGFLDLFAGCGAVGLDAWSRGAASVYWVESDRRVLSTLKQNVQQLCKDNCLSSKASAQKREVMVFAADAFNKMEAGNANAANVATQLRLEMQTRENALTDAANASARSSFATSTGQLAMVGSQRSQSIVDLMAIEKMIGGDQGITFPELNIMGVDRSILNR